MPLASDFEPVIRRCSKLSWRRATQFGRLDMAFNNAGIQAPPSDAADETAENFDRVNRINLRGVWACMKHEFNRCARREAGPS